MLKLLFGRKKVNNVLVNNVLCDLGPLYHSYSFFGVDNEQLSGIHELNQKSKHPIIMAYIAYAIAKSKPNTTTPVSFTELFCADGYYAMVAAKLGCDKSIGVDSNKAGHFEKAPLILNRLKLPNVEFIKEDITPTSTLLPTDIVANIGGLYHVDDPIKILELSYRMANKYLIVQSVVSLTNNDENYYVAPAPGWTWGNRFSKKSFDNVIKKLGYQVIDYHFNELEGNKRLEDRGSVYYLIKKEQ
jgi:hypothetical protein